MSQPIKVIVSGAGGRMGREVLNAVLAEAPGLELVGAVDPAFAQMPVSKVLNLETDIIFQESLSSTLAASTADVVVVFSVPAVAMDDIRASMSAGAVPVVGTTGISAGDLAEIRELSAKYDVGAIIAPNFAIGAVLMMKLSAEVANYLPAAEIIELHHDGKLDAPSGTSIKTAEMISASRNTSPTSLDGKEPARGEDFHGVRIHSVRLPGLVAHQEVIFGGPGQTLSIRHDSYDRKSFMPGVVLAIRKAQGLKEVIYGLESII